jgi:hypothetical protein
VVVSLSYTDHEQRVCYVPAREALVTARMFVATVRTPTRRDRDRDHHLTGGELKESPHESQIRT